MRETAAKSERYVRAAILADFLRILDVCCNLWTAREADALIDCSPESHDAKSGRRLIPVFVSLPSAIPFPQLPISVAAGYWQLATGKMLVDFECAYYPNLIGIWFARPAAPNWCRHSTASLRLPLVSLVKLVKSHSSPAIIQT